MTMKKVTQWKSTLFAASLLFAALLSVPTKVLSEEGKKDHDKESNASLEDGGELWSANCGRCHNKRSPEKFNDTQWEVIVRHMRVRANLTGSKERAIIDFLRTAN